MTITTRKTAELEPYKGNARTHSERQIAQIAASITEFGFTNPILVDENGGIIAGHGRLLAAKRLGLETVPCIQIDGLTDTQRRAYILADNKLALNAGWDIETLEMEIDSLRETALDLSLFGLDDLDQLQSLTETGGGADTGREPFQAISLTFADEQAELVKRALRHAKVGNTAETYGNINSNGNALFRMVEEWAEQRTL